MSRGWAPIDDDPRWEDEDYYDQVKPELDLLARKWSVIHDTSERAHFQRMSDIEEGYSDYDWEPEEQAFWQAQQNLNNELERVQLEVIENRIYELGARMMRPYEHWNEDEKYMSYMENRGY